MTPLIKIKMWHDFLRNHKENADCSVTTKITSCKLSKVSSKIMVLTFTIPKLQIISKKNELQKKGRFVVIRALKRDNGIVRQFGFIKQFAVSSELNSNLEFELDTNQAPWFGVGTSISIDFKYHGVDAMSFKGLAALKDLKIKNLFIDPSLAIQQLGSKSHFSIQTDNLVSTFVLYFCFNHFLLNVYLKLGDSGW